MRVNKIDVKTFCFRSASVLLEENVEEEKIKKYCNDSITKDICYKFKLMPN